MSSRSSLDKRKSRAANRAPLRAPTVAREGVTLRDRVEHARHALLERVSGSRLLDTPRGLEVRTIETAGERSDEVFARLVGGGATLVFLPLHEEAPADSSSDTAKPGGSFRLFLPAEPCLGVPDVDTPPNLAIQTALSSADLQRQLLQIDRDASTFEDEQGVCSLYLALGSLRWYDGTEPERARRAPLILLPVHLERTNAQSPFGISFAADDVLMNSVLDVRLRQDFAIELPPLPATEDLVPSKYADQVRDLVSEKEGWSVSADDMILGIYSFTALSMYLDLDPANWTGTAQIEDHPVLRQLLLEGSGTRSAPSGGTDHAPNGGTPSIQVHVVEADGAQEAAIQDVIMGDNLVIQGPPGAGKSQTITNLIAWAVRERKRVLVVSQKRAALMAVRRRLDSAGLGAVCLEVHSHKARIGPILSDLERTLSLSAPDRYHEDGTVHELTDRRGRLNAYVGALHETIGASEIDTYTVAGHLVRLAGRGVEGPGYELDVPLEWSKEEYGVRLQGLARLAGLVAEVGVPADHPWRGVGLSEATEHLAAEYASRAGALADRVGEMLVRLEGLAGLLGVKPAQVTNIDEIEAITSAVLDAPAMDTAGMASSVWEDQNQRITELVTHGSNLQRAQVVLGPGLSTDVWDHDLERMNTRLSTRSGAMFRLIDPEYRDALSEYRAVTSADPPSAYKARLQKLTALVEGQRAWRAVQADDIMGRAAFGELWSGTDSDWDKLGAIVEWERTALEAGAPKQFRQLVGDLGDRAALEAVRAETAEMGAGIQRDLRGLCEELQLDAVEAFGSQLDQVPIRTLQRRLTGWHGVPEGVHEWISYTAQANTLRSQGLAQLVEGLATGKLRASLAVDCFSRAYFDALLVRSFELHPALASFDGRKHEQVIEELSDLEGRKRLLARADVLATHHQWIPTGLGGGEVGILLREMRKQERRLSIRSLLLETGRTIQDLKPVFLMSPAAVARHLEPGALNFDVLLIDEASQLRPGEALGAILRAQQMVVLGDSEQLGPSRDFDRLASAEHLASDRADLEIDGQGSLLDLSVAQKLPQRRLDGHYSSRHASLISVSNREFYDEGLQWVPASGYQSGAGLRLVRVSEASQASTPPTHRQEAEAVAEAVMDHARDRPDVSLCVGTLTIAQRDAVADALEHARRRRPDHEAFFDRNRPEPFLIESVDALQGTVRDVTLILVGPLDEADAVAAPGSDLLVGDRGARRLNVLFSRARLDCTVFSSIDPSDIGQGNSASRGAALLRTYLDHARQGRFRVARVDGSTSRSLLEDEVAWSIRRAGFAVEHRVGSQAFVVDLAVLDPVEPGVFRLGVLFDGHGQPSARSARDRDGIKARMLEDRGWRIHRIWSLDWARDRAGEIERLLAAIASVGCTAGS